MNALQLYDTHARNVRPFVPVRPGEVGAYLCGATVQADPHLGHMRPAVNYDVLCRWLRFIGYRVTLVRNVTDIDDKVLEKAPQRQMEWWQLAYLNERAFDAGYAALGCAPPDYSPRATGHVPEMIALIAELTRRGHAYAAGGDVFFDVRSFADYGALSRQKPENMQPAVDAVSTHKRDPRDFAMWKGRKPSEPETASWETPWGPGRPGWHLECSAMAGKYLGAEFDIHGGGQDLIFPHHENELAQSCAAGRPFARYWVHNGMLTLSGEKMSKSVGNVIGLPVVFSKHRPVEVRYFLVTPHYRSALEYTKDAVDDAAATYRRLEGFVQRATERCGEIALPQGSRALAAIPRDFVRAMNDDLGTPQAMAVVHETARRGNTALDVGDEKTARASLESVRLMLSVLGLDPYDEQWATLTGNSELVNVVDGLVGIALEQREAARQRNDYAAADAVRDQLKEAGVLVEDTPSGPRWSLPS